MHKKQSGGSGQFADVAIRFEPGEPGSGFVFKSEIKGGTVPKEYIPGVLKVGTIYPCLSPPMSQIRRCLSPRMPPSPQRLLSLLGHMPLWPPTPPMPLPLIPPPFLLFRVLRR